MTNIYPGMWCVPAQRWKCRDCGTINKTVMNSENDGIIDGFGNQLHKNKHCSNCGSYFQAHETSYVITASDGMTTHNA
jgi:hypothetical protein